MSIDPPCADFIQIPCHIKSVPKVGALSGINAIRFALVPFATNLPRNSK